MNSLFIVLLLIIIWLLTQSQSKEDFATKKEKAEIITQWFRNNPNPTYTQYKQDFQAGTNIVEYEDALRLHQNGKGHRLIEYM